jgi:hypothetical protein
MKISELLSSGEPVLLHLSALARDAGHGTEFVTVEDANPYGVLVRTVEEQHPTRPDTMFYPWSQVVAISRGVERIPASGIEEDRRAAPTAGQRAKK